MVEPNVYFSAISMLNNNSKVIYNNSNQESLLFSLSSMLHLNPFGLQDIYSKLSEYPQINDLIRNSQVINNQKKLDTLLEYKNSSNKNSDGDKYKKTLFLKKYKSEIEQIKGYFDFELSNTVVNKKRKKKLEYILKGKEQTEKILKDSKSYNINNGIYGLTKREKLKQEYHKEISKHGLNAFNGMIF